MIISTKEIYFLQYMDQEGRWVNDVNCEEWSTAQEVRDLIATLNDGETYRPARKEVITIIGGVD